MTIKRHEPSKIYSKVVEANGFVFTAGIVADDVKQDAKGQTQQILKEIDRLLKLAGTDKTKLVSATIWVTDIRHRDAMNEAWNAWTGGENLPGRACIEAKLADPRMLVEIAVVAASRRQVDWRRSAATVCAFVPERAACARPGRILCARHPRLHGSRFSWRDRTLILDTLKSAFSATVTRKLRPGKKLRLRLRAYRPAHRNRAAIRLQSISP